MLAVSREYLHYHFENYMGLEPSYFNVEEAKQKILDTFTQRLANSINRNIIERGNRKISKEKAIEMLTEVTRQGGFGAIMEQVFSELQFSKNPKGENINMISTGAGFFEGHNKSDPIPEQAVRILDIINNKINNMVMIFSGYGEQLLVSQLNNLYSGQPIPKELSYLNGQGFSSQQLSIYDKIAEDAIKTLQQDIQSIATLAQGGQLKEDVSLYSLMRSLSGGFNTLGGILNEAAVKLLFDAANSRGYNQVTDRVKNIVSAIPNAKLRVYGANLVTNKIGGKDVKSDITVIYTENGIVYTFGGSIKNLQNKQSLKGGVVIKDIHSGFTFGSLIQEAYKLAGKNIDEMQGYEAALGAMYRSPLYGVGESGEYVQMWNSMKEYGKYASALRMLTGSGNFYENDFASILIVNDKIYSMYDILKNLCTNFDAFTGGFSAKLQRANLKTSWRTIRNKVKKPAERGAYMKTWRNEQTYKIIQNLYNRKLKMDLNLKKMISAGLL